MYPLQWVKKTAPSFGVSASGIAVDEAPVLPQVCFRSAFGFNNGAGTVSSPYHGKRVDAKAQLRH